MVVRSDHDGETAKASEVLAALPRRGSSTPPSRRSASRVAVRLHRRHRVEINVGLRGDSAPFTGSSENLSVGGIFVTTRSDRPPVGTEVVVTLELPTVTKPLRCGGRVAWHRDRSPTSESPPGMGIEFAELGEAEAMAIRDFLAHREPPLGV